MSFRWVVDPAHPHGHLVEMTAEEEAQHAADQQAWQSAAAAAAVLDGNAATLRTRLVNALAGWDTLTNVQKDSVLKALTRLAVHQLDTAN